MEIHRSDAGTFIRAVFHLTTLLPIYLFGISALSFAVFGPFIFLDFLMIQAKKIKWQFFFIIEPSNKNLKTISVLLVGINLNLEN